MQDTIKGVEVEMYRENAPFPSNAIATIFEARSALADATGTLAGELEIEEGSAPGLWLVELPTSDVEAARETGQLYYHTADHVTIEATIEE